MAAESSSAPLRGQPPVPLGTEIPPEPPDVGARTITVGARLLAGGTSFFFLAFVFAYFYLRSLNEEGKWRPPHIHPNQAFGAAMIACIVVSALLAVAGGRMMKARAPAWATVAGLSVLLGLAAVALQCIEYTRQNFGPTDGAYASVFVAWTGLYMIAVLGAMYWLETHVATELRARRDPARHGDIAAPDLLISPGLDAGVFYWAFLAAIGLLMWIVLYLL